MSETVAEFMEKPVKKYACGRREQQAKKTLMQAFTASDKKDTATESKLFESMLDAVMQTKKGRETLTKLSKLGYTFAFEKGNFGGFCCSEEKKIVINPCCPFEYSVQMVVHEGTHAIQASLRKKTPDYYSDKVQVASHLRNRRAIEADAVAHQMAFVYECKDILPAVYEDAKKDDLPMFRAYIGEMEKSGDERKAMQASFAAWYECDKYRKVYDEWHKGAIEEVCSYGKKEKVTDCMKEEYPASEVLKTCLYKGKPYMTEEFLNTGLAFSITPEDKKEIVAMIQDYAAAVGVKPDLSVLTMRERTPDGKLLPEKKSAKAAVVAKAVQARGR